MGPDPWKEELLEQGDFSFSNVRGIPIETPEWEMAYPLHKLYLDPENHRFLSLKGRLYPADDAFIGNDDPHAIELFDEDGRFQGPIVLEFDGNDVLDAGVFVNEEGKLLREDDYMPAFEDEPIRRHPGFNGSRRNPDGEPVIILDKLGEAADFTVAPYPLVRVRITSGPDAGLAGNWFNPDMSGEGLVLDVSRNAEGDKLLVVDWFTYAAEGSGDQVWLHGVGEMMDGVGKPDEFTTRVELMRPTGGRFVSTDNPGAVDREHWGDMIIQFRDCDLAVVWVEPMEAAFEREPFAVTRLTRPGAGTETWCSGEDWSSERFRYFPLIDP